MPGISSVTVDEGGLVTVNLTGNRTSRKCPALESWTVKLDGTGQHRPLSGSCNESRHLEFRLYVPPITHDRTVTLSYDRSKAELIFEGAVFGTKLEVDGAEVASFTDIAVTNLAPPPPSEVTVHDHVLTLTDDYKITVNLDRPIKSGTANCPAVNSWTVRYNDDSAWPYRITCHGRSVVLYSRTHNQSPALAKHRTVTVSYDKTTSDTFRLRYVDGTDVASFFNSPVTNGYPLLAGASVNGKALTLTYDQPLDERSEPPASAFDVGMSSTRATRGGGFSTANPVVGTSVSGATVTLTLEHAVPHNARVSLRYTPPASNPLRNPSGGKAKAITGHHLDTLPVTVLTPDTGAPPAFFSAGVKQHYFSRDGSRVQETWLWMLFDELLDESSAPAASAFTVSAASSGGGTRAVAVTGDPVVDDDEVRIRLGEDIPAGEDVTVSYVKPSANPLRDPQGNEVESFSGVPANNGAPRIESLALVSDPGSDRTYGRDEKVRVQVTFNEPVVVSGTPRLRITLGRTGLQTGDAKWVPYESGSGTAALTFAYTVQAGDSTAAVEGNADEGIAVHSSSLQLNGGRIRSLWSFPSHDAELAHLWLPYDARHKVDGSMKVPLFSSASVDGTTLTLTFDAALDTGSVPAPGAFYVTVNGARRNVASGGVAIDGAVVSLTLASAVSEDDTVTVRYTKPSANPLQSTSGQAVDTFTDQEVTNEVTNNSPIWSATLTASRFAHPRLTAFGCGSAFPETCASALDPDDSFTAGGASYRVVSVSDGVATTNTRRLEVEFEQGVSR